MKVTRIKILIEEFFLIDGAYLIGKLSYSISKFMGHKLIQEVQFLQPGVLQLMGNWSYHEISEP